MEYRNKVESAYTKAVRAVEADYGEGIVNPTVDHFAWAALLQDINKQDIYTKATQLGLSPEVFASEIEKHARLILLCEVKTLHEAVAKG